VKLLKNLSHSNIVVSMGLRSFGGNDDGFFIFLLFLFLLLLRDIWELLERTNR
jgi:hypothetical protein